MHITHIKALTTVAVKTRESTVPTPAHNEEDVEVVVDAVASFESNSPGCTTPSPFVSRAEIIAMCSSSVLY
jgi:hypothetical protein